MRGDNVFRLLVVALAIVGLFSIFGGLGFLFLPILFLGVMAFAGCSLRSRFGSAPGWEPSRRRRPVNAGPSREERFEEWHQIAHAREEVDGWVEGMPGAGQE